MATRSIPGALLLLGALLLSACGDQRTAPLSSMRSPDAVHAARWCAVDEGEGVRAWRPAAACVGQSDSETHRLVSRALIANRGNRFVHLLDTDARRPAPINLDLSYPGVTGLEVPSGPAWVFGLRAPALALVVSEEARSVSLVDAARGRTLLQDLLRFDDPIVDATAIPGQNAFVVALGSARELQVFSVRQRCGTLRDEHRSDCRVSVRASLDATWSLDGTPRHVVADARGHVYALSDGAEEVSVLGLFGQALASCGGAPCELARLSPRLPCELELADALPPASTEGDPGATEPGSGDASPIPTTSTEGDRGPSAENASEDGSGGASPAGSGSEEGTSGSEGPGGSTTADDADRLPDPEAVAARCARVLRGEARRPLALGPMALTERGDLLLVAERQASELLVFDTRRGVLIDVNTENRLRDDAVGIPIPSALISHVLTHTIDFLDPLPGGRQLQRELRVAYVSTTAGQTWVLELDEYNGLSVEGELVEEVVLPRFRRRSRTESSASVQNLNCRLPEELDRLVARRGLDRCDNPLVPVLRPVDDEITLPDGRPWTSAAPADLFGFPMEPVISLELGEDAEEVLSLIERPNRWSVPTEQWELRWEGALPGLDGRDLRFPRAGEVTFAGIGLCDGETDLCASGLDLRTCEPVRVLCEAGVDPCNRDLDLQTLCPSFSLRNRDFCIAGVEEGDILELIRPSRAPEADVPRECEPWVLGADGLLPADAARAEFEIVSVTPRGLEIAPRHEEDENAPEFVESLPPERCLAFGVRARVRASQSWLVTGGQRFGHQSAREAEGETCVPRRDRTMAEPSRAVAGERFTFPFGVSFLVEHPESRAVERDHVLSFRTVSNQTDAFVDTGASVAGAAVVRPALRNPRLVFADDARDTIRVFDARTLIQIAPFPIP